MPAVRLVTTRLAEAYTYRMEKLHFGTDGIRGVYGEEITDETAFRLGAALGGRGRVLLARDNRVSSPRLAAAFLGGVSSAGGECVNLGLSTTPALYYAHTRSNADYAVMITASHNPPAHNGLKVFDRSGKLDAAARDELMERMSKAAMPLTYREQREDRALLAEYRAFYAHAVGDLTGVRAVVDYAGGAGYAFGDLLPSLGAEIIPLNLCEKGDAVNVECGALHPDRVRAETLRLGADIGFALDGDGDRIIAVSREGDILDGDALLYVLARARLRDNALPKRKVALTVMTNSGVLRSLSEIGVDTVLCGVGDAAVTAAMRSEGLTLGGEQSGHVVLGDLMMTGDGLLVGGTLMKMIKAGESVAKPAELTIYPQAMRNVPVRDKRVASAERVRAAAVRVKDTLGGEGRVLVRASGTENVVRIMVECPDASLAERAAEEIEREVKREDASLN